MLSATHIAGLKLPRDDVNAHVVILNAFDVATSTAANTLEKTYLADAAGVRKTNLDAYTKAAAAPDAAVAPATSAVAKHTAAVAVHACALT